MKQPNPQDRLDRATSARLAKLASRPVDTSELERRLEQALGNDIAQEPVKTALRLQAWWRPITAAAAAILIVVTIGWLALDGGASPAMAAPAELAQIHFDVAKGLSPHLEVTSVEEANQLLAKQSNGMVPVPELPGAIRSCCLHQHASTTLTCASSIWMANSSRWRWRMAQHFTRLLARPSRATAGMFIAHTANGINMVMTTEGNRWLCVMGEVTTEQLIDVAVNIRM